MYNKNNILGLKYRYGNMEFSVDKVLIRNVHVKDKWGHNSPWNMKELLIKLNEGTFKVTSPTTINYEVF